MSPGQGIFVSFGEKTDYVVLPAFFSPLRTEILHTGLTKQKSHSYEFIQHIANKNVFRYLHPLVMSLAFYRVLVYFLSVPSSRWSPLLPRLASRV